MGEEYRYVAPREEHGSVELARTHAKRLSRWLCGGAEQGVRAYPLLTLPGWLANRRTWGDVVLIGAKDYEVLTGSPAIQIPGPLTEEICGRLAQRSGSIEAPERWEKSDNIEGGPFGVEKGAFLEIVRPRIGRPFLPIPPQPAGRPCSIGIRTGDGRRYRGTISGCPSGSSARS